MRDLEKELCERDQRIDDLLESVREQAEEIERLKVRIAELEAVLGQRKEANASKPPKFSGNYSLSRQEKQRSGPSQKEVARTTAQLFETLTSPTHAKCLSPRRASVRRSSSDRLPAVRTMRRC